MKNLGFLMIVILIVNLAIPIMAQPLDQIKSDKFDELEIPRRLMAIDNVCAWPNLSVLDDGTIIASIFNQPTHGWYEGDIDCWASKDGGLTWKYRGTPTQSEPYTVRMNHAAGVNGNGELIVLSSGWDNIRPRRNSNSKRPEATVSISKDGGKT